MNKLKYISIILLLSLVSCGQSIMVTNALSYEELVKKFKDLSIDSATSWEQVISVAGVLVDSISALAVDEHDLTRRLSAQEMGYVTIEYLTGKYEELQRAGKPADYNDITALLDRIYKVGNNWFYSNDEILPHLWRDHYYVCHKNAENPVSGYFHLMVTLPSEALPEPTLHIFYPDAADNNPTLIFCKYLNNDSLEEDPDDQVVIRPDSWTKKDEVEEGFPMHVKLGDGVINNLLHYDTLYLLFKSDVSPDGDPAESEIAMLSLRSFKSKWNEFMNQE